MLDLKCRKSNRKSNVTKSKSRELPGNSVLNLYSWICCFSPDKSESYITFISYTIGQKTERKSRFLTLLHTINNCRPVFLKLSCRRDINCDQQGYLKCFNSKP